MYLQRLDHTKLNIRIRWLNKLFVLLVYWILKIEVRPTENQIDDLLSVKFKQGLSVMNAYLLQRSLKR